LNEAMSEISDFLSRALLWPEGGPGFVTIHMPYTVPGQTRATMPGRAFTSFESCVGYIGAVAKFNKDIYCCMSLQATAQPGKKRKAIRGEGNTLALKGVWLDVDIKDGMFRDTSHALAELGRWRKAIGLPQPNLIVFTGSGGFHAHWTFDKAIGLDVWRPLAHALTAAVLDPVRGFHPLPGPDGKARKIDLNLTVNPVCLLRVPGTHNHKHTPPRPVQLALDKGYNYPLELISGPLAAFKTSYTPPPTQARLNLGRPSPKFAGIAAPRLDAGLESYAPTIDDVGRGCPFIAETLATGGAGYGEPLWFESLKVAHYCSDRDAAAHRLGSGHATYSAAATKDKLGEVEKSHSLGRFGWPQCETIWSAGSTKCVGCPHHKRGGSPLNYAVPISQAPASSQQSSNGPPLPSQVSPIPLPPNVSRQTVFPSGAPLLGLLPDGYFHETDGTVFRYGDKGDDGQPEKEVVAPFPLRQLQALKPREGSGEWGYSFECDIEKSGPTAIKIGSKDVGDLRRLQSVLGGSGMDMRQVYTKRLQAMVMSFKEQLLAKKVDVHSAEHYGWATENGTEVAFNYDRMRYNGVGHRAIVHLDEGLAKNYQVTGDPLIWRKACQMITDQKRPELDAVIGAAFGAPLVRLTGHSGFVMSIFSPDSGVQKTAAMRVSQAVWGHPITGMGGLDDTANYVVHKVSVLRHLPFMFDEVKAPKDIDKLANLVFAMSQGKSKGKLMRSTGAHDIVDFNTLLVTASNSSLIGHVSESVTTTTAGLYRIFEYQVGRNVTGKGMISVPQAQIIIGDLQKGFGHAGRAYAEYLGMNIEPVRKAVLHTLDAINNAVQGTSDERFWIANCAVTLLGARFANRIGWTSIDEKPLLSFLLDEFNRQRDSRTKSTVDITSSTGVERYISGYLNARRGQTLITDVVWRQASRPPTTFRASPRNPPMNADRFTVRVSEQDRVIRISISDFGLWLKKERGVERAGVLSAIRSVLQPTIVRAPITSHTSYHSAREDLFEFDLNLMPGFYSID
jgi:hypothetical protein